MLRESREITFTAVGIVCQGKILPVEVDNMKQHDIFAMSQAAYIRVVSAQLIHYIRHGMCTDKVCLQHRSPVFEFLPKPTILETKAFIDI